MLYITLMKGSTMQFYFYCLVAMNIINMFGASMTQYEVFNTLTPQQVVITLGVISLGLSATSWMMDKDYVKAWVLKHRYGIVVAEGSATLLLALIMMVVGVGTEILIFRWLILGIVCEALCIFISFVYEKMKEERGDGASISTKKNLYVSVGCTFGHILAIGTILSYPDINRHYVMYAHGIMMCIENVGLIVWMRQHDKYMQSKKEQVA